MGRSLRFHRIAAMYDLPYFKTKDRAALVEFMRQHPFATLIGACAEMPVATQVPVMLEEREEKIFLRGHVMKNTDHHKAFLQNSRALCLFAGAHTYVSARWYSNPQTGSTWNYMNVQAAGKIRFLGEPELRALLEELTAHFENDDNSPALFRHLPPSYVDSLVPAIVAFELEVETLRHVFKLSQNRDEVSYDNIIRQLQAQGGDGEIIATEMLQRRADTFEKKK